MEKSGTKRKNFLRVLSPKEEGIPQELKSAARTVHLATVQTMREQSSACRVRRPQTNDDSSPLPCTCGVGNRGKVRGLQHSGSRRGGRTAPLRF